jgi:class 3 adenylate cyclase
VKTVGDAFMIASSNVVDAAVMCACIQNGLHAANWPSTIVDVLRDQAHSDSTLWSGLRVRMSLHLCYDVEARYETFHQ